ncbi:MAG: hypothetical protein E6R03_16530 [Hyphomicrobiaceae bacterium]|nr:MAG: hypothetical protein E6R03_16530 [Hyphomicrobiaceae bacterium]
MSHTETPRITFRVTPITKGQGKPKPVSIKHGSITLKLYPTGRGGYIVPWYDHFGVRRLAMRATRAKAEEFARGKAEELTRADTLGAQLTNDEAARYRIGLERLTKLNLSYGEALDIAERVAAAAGLSGVSRHELLSQMETLAASRAKNVVISCPKIVAELLQVKEAEEAGVRWVEDLKSRLDRFAKDFPGPLGDVTADQIRAWLQGLRSKQGKPLGKRSWNNYRTALLALVTFSIERKYLAKSWDQLETIKPYKIDKGEEEIYTPKEMRAMLFTAEKFYPQHLPVLAAMGFAGCRHCEFRDESDLNAPVLEWRNFHFEKNLIHVSERVAKSNTGRRYVPIHENLRAWLEPYVKPSGPVCTVANLTNALARIATKAKVRWKQNGLRNSYISYRAAITHDLAKVSREAGNSVQEVSKSYLKELTETEGQEWFAIMPTKADVLPLFAHAKLLGNC